MYWECFYTGDGFELGEGSGLVKGFRLGKQFWHKGWGEFGMGERFRQGKGTGLDRWNGLDLEGQDGLWAGVQF